MALKINNNIVISNDKGLANISGIDNITNNSMQNILGVSDGIASYDSAGAIPLNLANGTLFYLTDTGALKVYDSSTGGRIPLAISAVVNPSRPGEIRGDISNIAEVSSITGLTAGTGGDFDDGSGLPSASSISALYTDINRWQSSKGGLQFWNTSREYTDSNGNTFGQIFWFGQGTISATGSTTTHFNATIRVDDSGSISILQPKIWLNSTNNDWDTTTSPTWIRNSAFADGWDSGRDKKIIAIQQPWGNGYFIDMTNPDSTNLIDIGDLYTGGTTYSFSCVTWNNDTKTIATSPTSDDKPNIHKWDSSGSFGQSPSLTRLGSTSGSIYVDATNTNVANGPICWLDDTHILILNGSTNTANKATVWEWDGDSATHSHYVTFSSGFQYATFAQCNRNKKVLYIGDRAGFYVISGSEFTKLTTGSGNPSLGSIKYYGKNTQTYMFSGAFIKPSIEPNVDGAIVVLYNSTNFGYRALSSSDGLPIPNTTYGDGDTSITETSDVADTVLDVVNGYILMSNSSGPGTVGFVTLKGAE